MIVFKLNNVKYALDEVSRVVRLQAMLAFSNLDPGILSRSRLSDLILHGKPSQLSRVLFSELEKSPTLGFHSSHFATTSWGIPELWRSGRVVPNPGGLRENHV